MKSMKVLIVCAALGVLVAFLLVFKQSSQAPHSTYMISSPPSSPFASSVAASGIIEAQEENVEVAVFFTGVVRKVFVKVGDKIKKGEPLLVLDDDLIAAQIEVDKKEVLVKEAVLEKNKAELVRLEAVKDPRAVSLDVLDDKRKDVAIATQDLELSKAKLLQDMVTREKYTVVSPRDGIVYKVDLREGEYIDNNLPQFYLHPRLTVGSAEGLQIRADVDEENAARVFKSMPAVAYTKGLNKVKLELECIRIEPYVIPKHNLTGATTELVDTRVLQVIYAIKARPKTPLYIGQQVDVYIKAK